MNATPKPASTALRTDSCSPSSSATSRSRRRLPRLAQLVLDHLPDAGALLHQDQRPLRQLVEVDRAPGERMPGEAGEDHLVAEERLERDRAVAPGGADDAELEPAVGDELDHRLRVGHGELDAELGVVALELAEQHREDDGRGPGGGAELERPARSARPARPAPRAAAPRTRACAGRRGRAAAPPPSARPAGRSGRAAASRAAARARAPAARRPAASRRAAPPPRRSSGARPPRRTLPAGACP